MSVAASKSKLAIVAVLAFGICLAGWPSSAEAADWIVQFRTHAGAARGARAAAHARRVFRLIPAMVVDDADLARVQHDPDVISIEPDVAVSALEEFPSPDEIEYGIDMVGAPEVWPITRGAGVSVAILDTGIDLDHPDLPAPVAVMEVEDLVDFGPIASDDNGHGTHVAGIIAAIPNGTGVVGVAPEVDLMVAKVLDYSGHGSMSAVIEGIEWAVENGADVINMSLGSEHGWDTESIALGNACIAAAEAGVVLVAAAGNEGNTIRLYPAAFVPVIAVGSVDSDGVRSGFSNYGDWVDVSAPGSGILSTYTTQLYLTVDGTSQASPHVAGTAALILAARESDPISVDELRCAIEGTATATAEGNPPVVDAAAAVARALQPDRDCDDILDALDACPDDPLNDADGDGTCGDVDNCPTFNPDQLDNDSDGHGDICDGDDDNDHVFPDSADNCPLVPNHDQLDSDSDGIGDACEADDADADGDGLPNVIDPCPSDPTNDVDQDGVCGGTDNCPEHGNADQSDGDGDGIGDACDAADADGDGVPDFLDACPHDPDDDADQDLRCGDVDNCPDVENADQADADVDGIGDACDTDQDNDGLADGLDPCPWDPANDVDGDGICGDIDNCPESSNTDQADFDQDGVGNGCDDDDDGDDLADSLDNCPLAHNPDQADGDQDGAGDACDLDLDGDDVLDSVDTCPDTAGDTVTDAEGCSIEQICPCEGAVDGAWRHHGAYLLCVSRTASRFVREGVIESSERTAILADAAQTSCR